MKQPCWVDWIMNDHGLVLLMDNYGRVAEVVPSLLPPPALDGNGIRMYPPPPDPTVRAVPIRSRKKRRQ